MKLSPFVEPSLEFETYDVILSQYTKKLQEREELLKRREEEFQLREVGLNNKIIEKDKTIEVDMQIKMEMSEKMYNLYLELHQAKQEIKNLKKRKPPKQRKKSFWDFFK